MLVSLAPGFTALDHITIAARVSGRARRNPWS
jgi:hypothetical protein